MAGEIDLGIDGLSDYREVGSGGFATVYSAFENDIGRRVAVKVMSAIDEAGRRRFDRERITMGQTTGHTNIVTLFRAGYTEPDNKPYLLMEYLAGGSLDDRLKADGPIPWPEAVDLILPVADALGFSHSSGIVHKDVKPANILLTQTGVAKLGDFGIAAIMEATATSQIAVSMHYTPPESFDVEIGTDGRPIDPRDERSDLYSLACTLYHLGTGAPPFRGATKAGLMGQILSEPLPETGHSDLDRFFATAMAKDPADRPPTAAKFVEALEAVRPERSSTAELPREAIPGNPGVAASGPAAVDGSNRRSHRLVTAGIVVLLCAVGGYAISQLGSEPDGAGVEASGVEASTSIPESDPEQASSTGEPPEVSPASDAEALVESGLDRFREGDLDAALADYDEALALDADNTAALRNRGILLRQQGDLDAALADLNRAIDLDPDDALALRNRGIVFKQQGDDEAALADLDRAIDLNPEDALAINRRGDIHRQLGALDAALADYDRAIAINPQSVDGLVNRGDVHKQRGNLAEALADFDLAIELDPVNALALRLRGDVHRQQGDLALALADYELAIVLTESGEASAAVSNLESVERRRDEVAEELG